MSRLDARYITLVSILALVAIVGYFGISALDAFRDRTVARHRAATTAMPPVETPAPPSPTEPR